MRCVVTGATGAVGPALVERLVGSGHAVAVYSRTPRACDWPADVETFAGDITDRDALGRACGGAEVVFHLAALLHVTSPDPSLAGEYRRVNVDGTRAVVESALAAGARRLVFFSTIAVYGSTNGSTVDEDTPPRPDSLYAATKLEAEAIARAARTADGTPLATVLRLASVYGPRIKGNYRRLVEALARRRFIRIGAGRNRRTLVFDADAADAAIAAATADAAAGRMYNVTDGAVHEMRDIVDAICRALGRTPPHVYLPAAPVRTAAVVLEAIARSAGVMAPIRAATIDKYLEEVAVMGTRITADVGWRASTALDEGWRRTVGTGRPTRS